MYKSSVSQSCSYCSGVTFTSYDVSFEKEEAERRVINLIQDQMKHHYDTIGHKLNVRWASDEFNSYEDELYEYLRIT